MTTETEELTEVKTEEVRKKTSQRILSIDVFRGLTILTMIFVNDLASVRNIPAWMMHMPADADGMTFVDLVFPAFLFIVGMSIPLAIETRMKNGVKPLVLWGHIFLRTAGLLLLGIMMLNSGRLNPNLTGMNRYLWMLIMYVSVILVWNQYPQAEGVKKSVFRGLKLIGIAALAGLALIYRSGSLEAPGWLQTGWWGILGLIGWSYLVCSGVYYFLRKNINALLGMLAFFVALYIGDKTGALAFLKPITDILWLGGHVGGHASITTAGMIVSLIITSKEKTPGEKTKWLTGFTVMLFAVGFLLRPLYGISKIYSTPAWSLYSAAICTALFLALYWIIDMKKISGWTGFLKPAGSNPLLAYILPDIFYALLSLFSIKILSQYFGSGMTGIIRSLVFSLIIVAVTALLTRLKVKLHL